MATKNRNFYVYKIINEAVSASSSGLRQTLHQKLSSDADNFGNRCKPILEGSQIEDVLASFLPLNQTPNMIAGEMWRIAPTQDMPKIPLAFFQQTIVSAEQIPDDPTTSSTDKSRLDYHFFLMTDDKLITTFSPTRVIAFANYLNDLLAVYRGTHEYKFDPYVILPNSIQLADISAITFSDRPLPNQSKIKHSKSKFGIFKTIGINMNSMFDDYGNINDLINEKIMSATMTLKLSKPRKMTDDVYRHKLAAVLRPLSTEEANGISFKLKNGREIKAMTIHAKFTHSFNDDDVHNKENLQNASSFMKSDLLTLQ